MSDGPRLLSKDEKKALEDRVLRAISNSSGQAAARASVLRPGLKYTDSSGYVLLDSAVTKSELCQLLGGIIQRLCEMLGVEIRVFESQFELPDDPETDQFLSGLLMSLDEKSIRDYLPSLKIDKKPYELGKTTGFLLRVRGEIVRGAYKHIGIQGLRTCHRYFGNDSSRPTNERERSARRSQLDSYLMRMFSKVQNFSERYKDYSELIVTLFQELRLKDLDDDVVTHIIDHYQKSFDDVRPQFERPITTSKKGSKSKVQIGTRRPKRPNTSPTLLNVEFKDFIDPLINVHWASLEHFKKDFKELVRRDGFAAVCRDIHDVYESRYEVTRNFSNLTTRRLQEARSYGLLKATAKKTDFTDGIRTEFFNKRDESRRVMLFVDELKKLIPEKYRYEAIRKLCEGISGVDAMSPAQLIHALADKVAMAYPRANVSIGTYQAAAIKVTHVREAEVRKTIEKLSKCIAINSTIPSRFASFKRSVFTRKQEVRKLQNFCLLKNEINEMERLLIDDFWTSSITSDVWKAYYACRTNIREAEQFRNGIYKTLSTIAGEIRQSFDSRDKKIFEPAPDAVEAVKEISDLLAELKL